MNLSGGEIEALARKSARGAGLPWGLAEEAGMATRWLAEHGRPGVAALAALLPAIDGRPPMMPVPGAGDWRPRGEALCPICTGAALADRLATGPLRLRCVLAPLLLVPQVALVASQTGRALAVDWPGGGAALGPDPVWRGAAMPARADVTLAPCEMPALPPVRPATPAPSDPEAVARLDAFARRIYAPAHLGRDDGAGAGLTDTD
ncbi:DUF3726 domain-containing protein [Jannaschia ovalis]|uniref:DUF3726 domain-containing protein n=1 Tax=Jannaschia ovalis TaxID=3038773 RepID=A0ABY8L9H7_9RHOB|nr:DUF3726 domain-containing protein [Jannaschia sp. GRR-S6-38]WGH77267.1 DUF3726 domain-containing protein [Jannaschia sp. GRR-S6-38]